jgi:hypothetical protein
MACAWVMQSTRSVITPDGAAQLWLQNFYDGCHNHYYRVQIHNYSALTITARLHVRVWVCGTFKEDLVWNDTLAPAAGATHASHVWAYGFFCGPQADNYDTYVWTPTAYHNPSTYLSI